MEKLKIGRPKGSKSTRPCRLYQLNEFLHKNAIVQIGTTWAEDIGLEFADAEVIPIKSVKLNDDDMKIEVKDLDLS